MFRDIIDYLHMTRDHAGSDLHICVGVPPACRVNGVITPLAEHDLDSATAKKMIYAVLTEQQRAKLEKEWEIDFAVNIENVGRFRANAHYVKGQIEAAFRFIPHEIPTLETLGHSPTVKELCNSRSGLILVTGMTGMGKTTTLAAMTQEILQNRSCMLITIEDPIEYVFQHSYGVVKQRQVGQDSHSFSAALRSALRQDPDVIVVSEMRDLETISAAITAAETGHLVISTLHTIDAPRTFDRLVDVFPPDQQSQISTQVANCLVGIISQKLLPRADKPGRVMASEILINNQGIAATIREQRFEQISGLMQIGAGSGMHTFDDSYLHLLTGGFITYEEAMANARDGNSIAEGFQAHLKKQQLKNR